MSLFYNEKPITDVLDYLKVIFEYSKNNACELWYRGHRDHKWKLRPSLFREQVLDMPNDGFVHPIKYKHFLDFNKAIRNFKRETDVGHEGDRLNLFHYTFLAQHYGIPTLALDWSTDPLIALYFAVDRFEYSDDDTFPVVYVLNPSRLNENAAVQYKRPGDSAIREPLCIDSVGDSLFDEWFSDMNDTPFATLPLAVKSNYDLHSHRISRQSGVFTLHEARFYRGVEWLNFTDGEGNAMGIAIQISPSCTGLIQEQLNVLNLTNETIYGYEETEMELKAKKISTETPLI